MSGELIAAVATWGPYAFLGGLLVGRALDCWPTILGRKRK